MIDLWAYTAGVHDQVSEKGSLVYHFCRSNSHSAAVVAAGRANHLCIHHGRLVVQNHPCAGHVCRRNDLYYWGRYPTCVVHLLDPKNHNNLLEVEVGQPGPKKAQN